MAFSPLMIALLAVSGILAAAAMALTVWRQRKVMSGVYDGGDEKPMPLKIHPATVTILLASVLGLVCLRHYSVPSGSMLPSIQIWDTIWVLKEPFLNDYQVGDIICFNHIDAENGETVYVKRMLAGPGDVVEISGNDIIVNGQKSPWTGSSTDRPMSRVIYLADDEYFMCGDNRADSYDSRYWGPVKRSDLIGRTFLIRGETHPGLGTYTGHGPLAIAGIVVFLLLLEYLALWATGNAPSPHEIYTGEFLEKDDGEPVYDITGDETLYDSGTPVNGYVINGRLHRVDPDNLPSIGSPPLDGIVNEPRHGYMDGYMDRMSAGAQSGLEVPRDSEGLRMIPGGSTPRPGEYPTRNVRTVVTYHMPVQPGWNAQTGVSGSAKAPDTPDAKHLHVYDGGVDGECDDGDGDIA